MTDFVSATCEGERCTLCGVPATNKVGEEIPHDDPMPVRHNLTAYVCAHHFKAIMHGGKKVRAPEMQSKTVRVRIPVRYDEGIINVDWVLETDKDKYTADRGGGILVAYVTTDIPLPQPVEIHAECTEARDD